MVNITVITHSATSSCSLYFWLITSTLSKATKTTLESIKDDIVVIIFPDHGSRYMSKIYSDGWMNEQGFFDTTNQEAPNKIEYI